MGKTWCAECGTRLCFGSNRCCRSCITRARWQAGRYARNGQKNPLRWTPEEEDILRHFASTGDRVAIQRALKTVGSERSVFAISHRAARLGIYIYSETLSLRGLMGLLGNQSNRNIRALIRMGLLKATPRARGRGGAGEWQIKESDVEAFIREFPWMFDAASMPVETQRLTRLARRLQRDDPWLTAAEAARLVGCHQVTINKWCRRGRLPFKRRLSTSNGNSSTGVIVVRLADLVPIQEQLAA